MIQQEELIQCDNVQCDSAAHLHDIQRTTSELLGAMTDSAWKNIEATKGATGDQASRSHTIPGWNNQLKPFKSEAKFWHSLWTSVSMPIYSTVPGVEHNQ